MINIPDDWACPLCGSKGLLMNRPIGVPPAVWYQFECGTCSVTFSDPNKFSRAAFVERETRPSTWSGIRVQPIT